MTYTNIRLAKNGLSMAIMSLDCESMSLDCKSHRNWRLKLNWVLETITAAHVRAIIEQSMPSPEPPEDIKKQSLTAANPRSKMMDYLPDLLPYVNQARDKGASSWLTSLPLQEQGLALNKQ